LCQKKIISHFTNGRKVRIICLLCVHRNRPQVSLYYYYFLKYSFYSFHKANYFPSTHSSGCICVWFLFSRLKVKLSSFPGLGSACRLLTFSSAGLFLWECDDLFNFSIQLYPALRKELTRDYTFGHIQLGFFVQGVITEINCLGIFLGVV